MPLYGDLGLGFPSSLLVFFVLVSSPILFVFLIRRKWRISGARKQEVRRLAYLASVEAERAELEARISYGFASSDPRPQCAVCYCPTTTRCARCKAVHYCSGKCQIIHWRRGHKEECHPPCTVVQSNGTESDSDSKAVSQAEQSDLNDNFLETDGRLHAQPIEAFPERPASSNAILFSGDFSENGDVEVKPLVDATGTDFITVSSTVSPSTGCSTSSVPAEKLINVSASEASVSSTPARSEGPSSDDIAPSFLRETADINETNPTKSPPSQNTAVAASVNSSSSSNLKQKTPSCSTGVVDCKSSNSSSSSLNGSGECTISEPSTAPVQRWEAPLDPRVSQNTDHDSSTQSSFNKGDHDSRTDFGFRFSFNLSGEAVPLVSPPSNQKTFISDDVHHRVFGNEMPVYEAAPLGNSVTDLSVKNSPGSSFESSASLVLKGGNDAGLVKSRGTSSLSCGASADHPSSSCGGDTVSSIKCSKVDSPCTVPTLCEAASSAPNVSNGLKTSMRKVVQQFKSSKLSKHYPLGYGSEIAGKDNCKMLFPYDLFIKLYNWNKVELRPCGLTNCGNSCYANAVLQCLAFTRPLTAYLLQGLHTKTCPKIEWCFTCEFEGLVLKSRQGKSPLSPIGILSQIKSIGSHLGHGKEEDAHEFLRYAIDTMQSVCLKEAGPNAVGQLSEETTLIKLIFGGYLRSRIKCMKCQGKSERQERMMDLTVEIQGDIGTLEEALTQFTATEILDGDNKYQCNRCKSYEKAKKKLTVLEAPNVLTIALKRFQFGKFGKLNKSVRFPEILDLAPYMSGTSDKTPIYNLYAVVVHLDIMNAAFSGHYVCYVKNIQGKWYKIDDSTVKPVELERVLSKGAYMLLYARCSPRAPSLIRKMMSQDYVKNKSRRYPDSVPSSHGEKGTPLKATSNSSEALRRPEGYPYWATLEGPTSFESFDSFEGRFLSGYRIPKADSSSDNSSLFSCSDEGSCSTESTRDSTSTDEYSEYLFGDSGHLSWNGPVRVSENDSPEVCFPSSEFTSSGREVLWGKESPAPLYFDKNEQCRKLADRSSRSETDSGLVNPSGLTLRRCKERPQTFY